MSVMHFLSFSQQDLSFIISMLTKLFSSLRLQMQTLSLNLYPYSWPTSNSKTFQRPWQIDWIAFFLTSYLRNKWVLFTTNNLKFVSVSLLRLLTRFIKKYFHSNLSLKLDTIIAFDTIYWKFIFKVIKAFGIYDKF